MKLSGNHQILRFPEDFAIAKLVGNTGTQNIWWFPADLALIKVIENRRKSWLPESLRSDQKVTTVFAILKTANSHGNHGYYESLRSGLFIFLKMVAVYFDETRAKCRTWSNRKLHSNHGYYESLRFALHEYVLYLPLCFPLYFSKVQPLARKWYKVMKELRW